MTRQIPIAEARDHLTALLRRVEGGEAIELTRRGKPVAALVSIAEYLRLKSGPASPWQAIEAFRAEIPAGDLADVGAALEGLRDESPGREVPR